jgi:hypothetical protein
VNGLRVNDPGVSLGSVVRLLVGVAGMALCLTLLFLGMRAVMGVGGACADGGPYVSAQPCPDGVAIAMVGGIFGLFLFGGLAGYAGAQIGGPYAGIVFLAWPALFLSLGWNFLEFAVRPPDGSGIDWGWLICGVVFVIMGAGPLLTFLPSRSSRRDPAAMRRLLADLQARSRAVASPGPTDWTMSRGRSDTDAGATDTAADGRSDLTSRLERLAALHRGGQLTDAEFDEAKRRVIAEVAAGR